MPERRENWLTARITENKTPGTPNLFISIPKKIVPLATQRNRIKRLIREALRLELGSETREKTLLIRIRFLPRVLDLETVSKAIKEQVNR